MTIEVKPEYTDYAPNTEPLIEYAISSPPLDKNAARELITAVEKFFHERTVPIKDPLDPDSVCISNKDYLMGLAKRYQKRSVPIEDLYKKVLLQ